MIPPAFFRLVAALAILLGFPGTVASAGEPLRAHPQKPHLLEFRGRPTLLRTFAESYNSIIDAGLPFIPYLDVLQRDGMNLTRVWCIGFPPDAAATPADFLQPWPRVTAHGNALDGHGKWDLSAWNEAYFSRLKAFAQAASDRGIVVEITLFSVLYDDDEWRAVPFHPSNNVQGYGPNNCHDCFRPVDANLLAAQQAAVRRIVNELNGFDNVYFEIQNEPFWNEPDVKDSQEAAFHNGMLAIIRDEESGLPNRHLVAHNFPQQIAALSPGFDMLNEHYPAAVPYTPVLGAEALLNDHYAQGKILSLDETDTADALQTRLESWMFLAGGGGIYDGLDAHDYVYSPADPSGDTPLGNAIRGAVRNAGTYLDHLHLTALRRDLSWLAGGIPTGATAQAMASPGQQYVAYFHHGQRGSQTNPLCYHPIDTSNHSISLNVTLEAGSWRAVWTRPSDLAELASQEFIHGGGTFTLSRVFYQADVALRIDRTGAEDTTPPASPTGVNAAAGLNGLIAVSWNPIQSYDFAGYRIYRIEDPETPIAEAQRIADLPEEDLSFTDDTPAFGATYYYAVTAVDHTGNESAPSTPASATAVLPEPQLEIRVSSEGQIVLRWTAAIPGWILQENASLDSETWTNSSLTPAEVEGFYQVTVPPEGERKFFRLARP